MGVFSTAKLDKKKVMLGLSGGVDSTAAVLLLQEQGYEVTGLYFDIMPEGAANGMKATANDKAAVAGGKKGASCGRETVVAGSADFAGGRQLAEAAARQLGIGFIYRNVAAAFEQTVIENFCQEYASGRTPNPCIVCNPGIKFQTLLDAADEAGAYYIATGHYADTYHDETSGIWYIKRAASERKDQSYMLYRLGQEAISRLLLPLRDIEDKEKVRALAREKSLQNAEAKDSQEICFIEADDHYKDFLARRGIMAKKGNFVDSAGTVLGEHQGILNYTIGQRKGLGIALGRPVFVTGIDGAENTVALGGNEELLRREVISAGNVLFGVSVDEFFWERRLKFQAEHPGDRGALSECAVDLKTAVRGTILEAAVQKAVTAKIRYAAKPAEAAIELLPGGRIKTVFAEPQRAVTPGQSIVFYIGDLVIGGGFIE